MKALKIHCFQHADFEGLGCIEEWCEKNGHPLSYTRFFKNEPVPHPSAYDCLVIMGGPMNVNEVEEYPWLRDEKSAIKEAIEQQKTVIGICLGAQLIANVLGASSRTSKKKEIGWFDISLTEQGKQETIFEGLNSPMKVFHWHGDSFDLPANTRHLAFSEAYPHQAFMYKSNVLGLQFHLEVTRESINAMVENGKQELTAERYIQTEEEILSQQSNIADNNHIMYSILDRILH